jgi:hypothetical protein
MGDNTRAVETRLVRRFQKLSLARQDLDEGRVQIRHTSDIGLDQSNGACRNVSSVTVCNDHDGCQRFVEAHVATDVAGQPLSRANPVCQAVEAGPLEAIQARIG